MITVIVSVGSHVVGSFLPVKHHDIRELHGLMGYKCKISTNRSIYAYLLSREHIL